MGRCSLIRVCSLIRSNTASPVLRRPYGNRCATVETASDILLCRQRSEGGVLVSVQVIWVFAQAAYDDVLAVRCVAMESRMMDGATPEIALIDVSSCEDGTRIPAMLITHGYHVFLLAGILQGKNFTLQSETIIEATNKSRRCL